MNKKRIVNMVREGYLEKEIQVIALGLRVFGKWYAVDLDDETIELEIENEDVNRVIIDFNSIIAIGYLEKEVE